MPLYTLKNKQTQQVHEMLISYEAKVNMLDTGEWEEIIGSPMIVAGQGSTIAKTSDGYKDLLKNIKKHSGRDNTINV